MVKKISIQLLSIIIVLLFCVCCGSYPESMETEKTSLVESVLMTDTDLDSNAEETDRELKYALYFDPEVQESLHDGKNKYEITLLDNNSECSSVGIYLPLAVENYIDETSKTFDMHRLLDDYGWIKKDDYYYFDVDDLRVILSFWVNDEDKLAVVKHCFVNVDDGTSYYEKGPAPVRDYKATFFYDFGCDYSVYGDKDTGVVYDECIVLAYIISWVAVEPQTNGLAYLGHPSPEMNGLDDYDNYYFQFS
ncbi:MAG: hypothetical protein K6G47_10015 [Clostridia bacterium]|nr:hypothetical protein [Clostridia bacterium]